MQKHQASDSEKIDWKFIKEFLENWCGRIHDDLCRVLIDGTFLSRNWKLLYDSVISELMHAARIHNNHKPKLLKALVYSFFDFVTQESVEYELDFDFKNYEDTFTALTYKEYMDAYKEMYGSVNAAGYLQTPTFKKIVEYIYKAYYTAIFEDINIETTHQLLQLLCINDKMADLYDYINYKYFHELLSHNLVDTRIYGAHDMPLPTQYAVAPLKMLKMQKQNRTAKSTGHRANKVADIPKEASRPAHKDFTLSTPINPSLNAWLERYHNHRTYY